MDLNSKIYIAGHKGMVGSAIKRNLEKKGYTNFVSKSSSELDLRDANAVKLFFETEKPEYVFLAAAKVGGIQANNTYRAEFLYDNLMIQNNVIHYAYLNKVINQQPTIIVPEGSRGYIMVGKDFILPDVIGSKTKQYSLSWR